MFSQLGVLHSGCSGCLCCSHLGLGLCCLGGKCGGCFPSMLEDMYSWQWSLRGFARALYIMKALFSPFSAPTGRWS